MYNNVFMDAKLDCRGPLAIALRIWYFFGRRTLQDSWIDGRAQCGGTGSFEMSDEGLDGLDIRFIRETSVQRELSVRYTEPRSISGAHTQLGCAGT